MTIRAVLFDLDGTLVDTLGDIVLCVNTCLKEMGEPGHDAEAVRMMVGDGVETLCRRALGESARARTGEMVTRVRAYYRKHPADTAAPYPGIVEMLKALGEKGIRLAVLTNKPEPIACELIERLFAPGGFELVLGQRDGMPMKPDPGGALWVADKMDLKPSSFFMVGDTEIDLKTGRAAGMHPLGVTWGFRLKAELKSSGAWSLVDAPLEILSRIESD